MKFEDLVEQLYFIQIERLPSETLAVWKKKGSPIYPIDIITAREHAIENVFKHSDVHERKLVYIKRFQYIFIIEGKNTVQYQLLEAILEEISKEFIETYGEELQDYMLHSIKRGFSPQIPEYIKKASKESVKWIYAHCRICNKQYRICVRKSLIKDATDYPVSLVYFHEGHGLLLYIDADFQIRGAELVSLTG